MTRDEAREKCFEAQTLAYVKAWQAGESRLDCFRAAFDTLNGIARVVPIEATEEMIMHANLSSNRGAEMMWKIMSTWGDLTNARGRSP